MIYLLLSILCATAIYVVFKLFGRYKLNNFQAIVINYYVAAGFGFANAFRIGSPDYSLEMPWLWNAAIIGFLFISLFYIMAITSQKFGVAVTGIATKMSMVIPAFFFIITDGSEALTFSKGTGILLGIIAVYLASVSRKVEKDAPKAGMIPIVLFIGTGVLDLALAYTEKMHLTDDLAYRSFVPVPFAIAALIGTVVWIFQWSQGKGKLNRRSLIGGLILGFVNYGSIYFLLRILGSGILDRSSAIPANNMGVVALSAVVGLILFREKLSARKLAGIGLALLAIGLLTYEVSVTF